MGQVLVVNFVSIDGVIQSPLSPDADRDGRRRRPAAEPPVLLSPLRRVGRGVLGAGKRMFGERGHLARFTLTDTVVSPHRCRHRHLLPGDGRLNNGALDVGLNGGYSHRNRPGAAASWLLRTA
jgi:hypothetical protein